MFTEPQLKLDIEDGREDKM